MRANTLSIEFVDYLVKIPAYTAHMFIKESLKLEEDEVVSIGIYGNKIMIKVSSIDLLESLFSKYEESLEYVDVDGKSYNVKMTNESSKNIVKIHGIPIEIADLDIKKSLSHYGVIENVSNDTWKRLPYKCYNDIKIIKMEIHRPIPSYVRIAGKQYWVTYVGQVKTCRKCASTEHEAKDCTFSINSRLRESNYANVVSGQFRRQYWQDREQLMKEQFTMLGHEHRSNRSNASEEENQNIRQDNLPSENQPENQTEMDIQASNSDEEATSEAITTQSDKTRNSAQLQEEQQSNGESDKNEPTRNKEKKRKKKGNNSSNDSESDTTEKETKKVNWADETEDDPTDNNVDKRDDGVERDASSKPPPKSIMRSSSVESSY